TCWLSNRSYYRYLNINYNYSLGLSGSVSISIVKGPGYSISSLFSISNSILCSSVDSSTTVISSSWNSSYSCKTFTCYSWKFSYISYRSSNIIYNYSLRLSGSVSVSIIESPGNSICSLFSISKCIFSSSGNSSTTVISSSWNSRYSCRTFTCYGWKFSYISYRSSNIIYDYSLRLSGSVSISIVKGPGYSISSLFSISKCIFCSSVDSSTTVVSGSWNSRYSCRTFTGYGWK